jgi:CBS domain containing-hemolysin-like protein
MKILYCSFYPIVYPTAKLLDCILGEHGTIIYPKKDLKTLIEIHQKVDDSDDQGFNQEEVLLIKSLLEMTE